MLEVIKQIIESNFANIADLSQDHNTFQDLLKKKKKKKKKSMIQNGSYIQLLL